ncbi:MAG: hypothetical protein VB997_01950, partial [Opitutales bacterium]
MRTLWQILPAFLLLVACESPERAPVTLSPPTHNPSTVNDSVPKPSPAAESSVLDQWPQWRGPLATGEAPNANPPIEWSEEKNVRWKTSLPCEGHST